MISTQVVSYSKKHLGALSPYLWMNLVFTIIVAL